MAMSATRRFALVVAPARAAVNSSPPFRRFSAARGALESCRRRRARAGASSADAGMFDAAGSGRNELGGGGRGACMPRRSGCGALLA